MSQMDADPRFIVKWVIVAFRSLLRFKLEVSLAHELHQLG